MEYPLLKNCYADWKTEARKIYDALDTLDIKTRMTIATWPIRLIGASRIPMKFRGKAYLISHDKDDYWKYNVLSDFFTEIARVKCNKKNCMALVNYWRENQDAIVAKVGNDTLACREEIYNQYGQGRKECTLHRPIVTIAIYKYFKARRVLDPCIGWGGRLIASLIAKCELYVGIDPNEDLHSCYGEIKELFGDNSQLFCCPFEDFEWQGELFDLAYTSPPYFDLEIYGNSPGQSIIRHPTLDQWIAGFLIPLLRNCIKYVKIGGYIAINISGMQYIKPMLNFMAEQHQEYLGVIGFARSDPSEAMPIFVWKRT